MLHEDIGQSLNIGSVTFARFDSGGPGSISMYDFEVRMGLTDLDTLGSFFDDNYLPGSRQVTFLRDTFTLSPMPDQEIQLLLDAPFDYSQQHNLLIEILWSACSKDGDLIYSWNWETDGTRSMVGFYSSPAATVFRDVAPWLVLDEPTGLKPVTWGSLKAQF